jgi:hypothetical protein
VRVRLGVFDLLRNAVKPFADALSGVYEKLILRPNRVRLTLIRRFLRPAPEGQIQNFGSHSRFTHRLRLHSSAALFAASICAMNMVAVAAIGSQAFAQAPRPEAQPVLHHRSEADTLEEGQYYTISRGRTTLPSEVSGEYSLGESGELVEIDIQPTALTGYISRLGDAMSDAGTPLTFFFETSWLHGPEIGFTTRRVHGTWFTFAGTIVRGNAETRYQDGYYELQGNLTLHDPGGSAQTRDVSLPMTAQYSGQ